MIRLLIVKQRSGPLSDRERRWAVRYLILSVLLAVLAWGTLWRAYTPFLHPLPAGTAAVLPLLHLSASVLLFIRGSTCRYAHMLTVHGIFLILYYLASAAGLSMLDDLLPPWTFAACIILLLGIYNALLIGFRGFAFGFSTSSARSSSQAFIRFHHALALPAVILPAWYYPMEHSSFSLIRFGIMALVLLHLGMAGTSLHRSIWWNTLIELLLIAMLALSAAYSGYWQVLLVSASILFTCTGLYGLRWSRMAHMIIQAALIALLAWYLLTSTMAELWQPFVLPLSVYAAAAVLLAASAVMHSRNRTT